MPDFLYPVLQLPRSDLGGVSLSGGEAAAGGAGAPSCPAGGEMLPAAAAFRLPWEISRGAVKDGEALRTVGRLVCYRSDESRATLSAQQGSAGFLVSVNTAYVEPFNPIIGAQYFALGEVENAEGAGVTVRARVLSCVDGVNVALLQKAVTLQRSFLRQRQREGHAAAADV